MYDDILLRVRELLQDSGLFASVLIGRQVGGSSPLARLWFHQSMEPEDQRRTAYESIEYGQLYIQIESWDDSVDSEDVRAEQAHLERLRLLAAVKDVINQERYAGREGMDIAAMGWQIMETESGLEVYVLKVQVALVAHNGRPVALQSSVNHRGMT